MKMNSYWRNVSIKLPQNGQAAAEISELHYQLSGCWFFMSSINLGQCCIIITTAIFQDCPHDVTPNWAKVISCMISNSTSDLRPDLIFLDIHFFHSHPLLTLFILELHKCFSVLVKTWGGKALFTWNLASFALLCFVTKDHSLFLWRPLIITLKNKASSIWVEC